MNQTKAKTDVSEIRSVLDKSLPSVLEIEKSILNALVSFPKTMSWVTSTITPDDFFLTSHQEIYKTILAELSERTEQGNEFLDYFSIEARLKESNQLDLCGGAAYLNEVLFNRMLGEYTTQNSINRWCELLIRAARKRQVIKLANQLMLDTFDDENFESLLDSFTERLETLRFSRIELKAKTPADIDWLLSDQERVDTIPSGFNEIDKLLAGGGFGRGHLVVIAARTSKGKSTVSLQIADQISRGSFSGERTPAVLFAALEMSRKSLYKRLLTIKAAIGYDSVQSGEFTQDEYQRWTTEKDTLKTLELFINDDFDNTIENIWREATALKNQVGIIDAIIVDHLGLVGTSKPLREDWQRLGYICKRLRAMAKKFDCPVIVPVQINREAMRNGGRFMPHHLRGSGDIEQDADAIIIIQDPSEEQPEGYQVEWTLAKQREGITGSILANFLRKFGGFEEIPGSGEKGLRSNITRTSDGLTLKSIEPDRRFTASGDADDFDENF